MNGWLGTWAKAQITGTLVSTVVWIMVAGLSVPALAAVMAAGCLVLVGRNTRVGFWWRFGARPANGFQRDAVLAAIVPITSLRGRNQPAIWIGRRLVGRQVVMASCADLIVSQEFLREVASGQLTDRQASAIVSHALGQHRVNDSILVNAVDAYCAPWRVAQILTGGTSRVAVRNPILGFAWKIRWIVFAAAAVDAYRNERWAALIGVTTIALLSWSTGYFQNRWAYVLQDLGDQRTIADDLGGELADIIRRCDSSPTSAADGGPRQSIQTPTMGSSTTKVGDREGEAR